MFFPNYVLGDAMLQISNLESLGLLKLVCEAQRDPTYIQTHEAQVQKLSQRKYDAFDWDAVGLHCTVLFIEFVVYTSIALLIDVAGSYPKLKATLFGCTDPSAADDVDFVEDVDIVAERERMQRQQAAALAGDFDVRGGDVEGGAKQPVDALAVTGLRKVFRTTVRDGTRGARAAVENSWFGVQEGEVFGLLGVNGAGKSTTLKMLSGDLMPTEGTAEMCGNDILTQQLAVRRLLGYCPQHNALLPLLTVEEHLQLFARIKGVRCGAPLKRVVEQKMTQLDLLGFRRTRAGNLSGGNKRKLCVGIALIGNPKIIFLDEPSAGALHACVVWPVARRRCSAFANSPPLSLSLSFSLSLSLCPLSPSSASPPRAARPVCLRLSTFVSRVHLYRDGSGCQAVHVGSHHADLTWQRKRERRRGGGSAEDDDRPHDAQHGGVLRTLRSDVHYGRRPLALSRIRAAPEAPLRPQPSSAD